VETSNESNTHRPDLGRRVDCCLRARYQHRKLNKGAAHDQFLSTFIGVKNTQFRSNWSSLVFAGQAAMPPSFDSEAEVVDYVAHHPFAFGYIQKETPHEGVKVLAVK
jgi:hypothetical protein